MIVFFLLFLSTSFGASCYYGEEVATWNENTKEMLYTKDYHFYDEQSEEVKKCVKCTKVCIDSNSEFVFHNLNYYQFEENDVPDDMRYPYTTVYVGQPDHTIRFIFNETRKFWYHKPVFQIPNKNFTKAKLILDVYPPKQGDKIGSDVHVNTNGFDLENPIEVILRKKQQDGFGFDDFAGLYFKGNKKEEPLRKLKFNILYDNEFENDFTTWDYRIFGFQQMNKFEINELKFNFPVKFDVATQTSLRFTDWDDCYYKTTKVTTKWNSGISKDYFLYVTDDIFETQYGYQYIFIDEKEPIIEKSEVKSEDGSTNTTNLKDESSLKTIMFCLILIIMLFI